MQKKLILITVTLGTSLIGMAQTITNTVPEYFDPHNHKIIPDKVFEIGLPLLLIFILSNVVVTILKNKAEHQLKLKMIEKDLSENTLITIFRESNVMSKYQPLKWFLFSFALSISFFIIHAGRHFLMGESGYLALSIILFWMSVAFLIYYRILSSKI